ncbi:MAG: energy transducer TonB [Tannerella sp.]|jgi:protein TonB|nr:energy transducer TonB [Tannerella sp.]
MEIKKSPKADLEKGKGLSLLMGVVVGLAILFVGFEWGTSDLKVATDTGITDIMAEEDIESTNQDEPPPPPPPPPPAPVAPEELNVVENDAKVEQADLASTEDDASKAQTQTYVPPAVVERVEEEEASNTIFVIVEKQPEFPGGMAELMSFLNKSIKYPMVAQENGIQGRVTCSFIVEKDGSITGAEVVRGVDVSLDKEALRVINSMPKWKPGEQRGKPVRVKFNVPVNFRLQN